MERIPLLADLIFLKLDLFHSKKPKQLPASTLGSDQEIRVFEMFRDTEILWHLSTDQAFTNRVQEHLLPSINNDLVAQCWLTSLILYTSHSFGPLGLIYSATSITETPSNSKNELAAETNWNGLPHKPQPRNQFDETELIAGSLVLN